ncbi:MAG: hypothetical protein HQL33_00410 [Alphaproteobacteria bacterium]|nr:hypothetical protein [Alphaproteobacteria bacterium]MBF0128432.1 hypothetical protein [Alphaproteobacteria bacterium]
MTPQRPLTRPAPAKTAQKPASGDGVVGKMAAPVMGSPAPRPLSARNLPPRPSGPATAPGAGAPEMLFEAAKLLADHLDAENAALKKLDFAKVRELAERKESLTRLYADHMKAIAANREVLNGLAPERRLALKKLGLRLDASAGTNGRLLKANVDASRRLVQTIIEAVKETKTGATSTYSDAGRMVGDPGKGHETALTFDQDI